MHERTTRRNARGFVLFTITACGLTLLAAGRAEAQGNAPDRVQAAVPRTLRAAAPIDLTGYWVAQGTEDYRYRWIVADAGDLFGVPVNAKGREVADNWDPAADDTAGLQCKAYGAPGLMRIPGRIHITWQDDNALKVETDAGTQTRLFTFAQAEPAASQRSWQGFSSAVWEVTPPSGGGGGRGRGGNGPSRHAGQLKVVTTNLRAGYLRKNGVPYSENATMTEYFARSLSPNGDEFLVVTNIVVDPLYLNERFITSTNFKKESDGSKWSPTTCSTREPR